MPNGSLDKHIFFKGGKRKVIYLEETSWNSYKNSSGIEYLHEGCDVCILHFDIKPHNILVDHNFGLAKLYPKKNDFWSINITREIIRYIALKLIFKNFGVIFCKLDVYNFVMLLLEMVGVRSFLSMETRSSKIYFLSWAYDQILKGVDLEIQDEIESEIGITRKLS